jgi:hypothetical protein
VKLSAATGGASGQWSAPTVMRIELRPDPQNKKQSVAMVREIHQTIMKASSATPRFIYRLFPITHQYDPSHLKKTLRQIYGDSDLSSSELKTCLVLISARLDTGQLAYFTNFSDETQNHPARNLKISDLLYGCLSVPMLFPPSELKLPTGENALLQTGALSLGQNPSLYLFLLATSPVNDFRWRTGKRWLQLFSVGAQRAHPRPAFESASDVNFASLLTRVTDMPFEDANELNRLMLENFARTEPFDRRRIRQDSVQWSTIRRTSG